MAGIPSSSVGQAQSGEPAAPVSPHGAAAWEPWTVAVAFIAALALALAGRAVVAAGSGDSTGALLGVGIALIALNVAPIGLALLLANVHGKPSAADFGLRRPPLGRALVLLLGIWISLTVMTVLWVAALGISDEEGPLTARLGTDGTLTVLVLIVVLTILAPLQEELFFRGYIFRALRNRQGPWPAAVTTGIIFAAIHAGWIPMALIVPVIVMGIALCLLYHWTGSLYPGIALHVPINSIPLASALDWSWQTPGLIAGATLTALTIARLLALALGGETPIHATSTAAY